MNKHEAVGNIGQNEVENLRLREVVNYVNALENALEKIKEPNQLVNLDIMKIVHKTLMAGVRGEDKNPGEFRMKQNWIVKTQGTTKKIIYTPPPPEKILDLLKNLEIFFHMKIAHKTLMTGVRGEDKNPGEFRMKQNWIVKTQGTTKKIIYTPPPPEKILDLLKNLEIFFQSNHRTSTLIQCAITHYQFEAIHPFLDGNGRIGRLLLPLILYKKGLLPEPLLYLSAYFDKHQKEYYDGLLAISQKSKWSDWIKFFLKAFTEQTILN